MKIGAEYRREHVLADGTRVVVRPIRPSDAAELRDAFARLSPSSRYRRFFGAVSELSPSMLEYLTNVDGVSHFAVVAVIESPDLKSERGVGVARFIRVDGEPDVAEAAITVVDDMQQRGLGRVLLATLAIAAAERGVHRFRGELLASNAPMRGLLAEVGAVVRSEGATLVFDVDLGEPEPEADRPSSPALARLLREAASSVAIFARHFLPPSSDAGEGGS